MSESMLQGLAGLFRRGQRAAPISRTEAVRAAMIEALGGRGPEALCRRLRYAIDIEALWHLRTELHLALSQLETEHAARERIEKITDLFVGAVPGALLRRSGRLAGRGIARSR